ncbi:MAG TPA: YicC family protein [Chitinophagales bacterium]|nr:YicC family protein [Chitinophagales bacterium]
MLKSMTGFGKASGQIDERTVNVEIKSLNSQKGLDLSIKLPSKYREYEYALRNKANSTLQRGKIDVYITLENNTAASELSLNKELIKSYFEEFRAIANEVGASTDNLLPTIMKMPDVIGESHEEASEDELKRIEEILSKAIAEVESFRINEGKSLLTELTLRIGNIEKLSGELQNEDKRRVVEIRERLKNNLENFIPKDKIDANRFEQEVIYYIEKLDITEELTRLKSHCEYFRNCLTDKEELKGRKLNFIAQELGREINTVGSKANDATMQKIVVNMKDELEKIKEQTNNIL